MFDFDLILKLLHILSAMALVTGIAGRQIVRAQAHKTQDINMFQIMIQLSGRFESLLVMPGSMAVLVSGIIVAIKRDWPIFGFLQGADSNWMLVSLILVLAMIPIIIFIFIPRGKRFEAALVDAVQRQEFTPELRAAINDPMVRAAHVFELASIAVVIYLMVLKPI